MYSNSVLSFGDTLLIKPFINIIKPDFKGGRYYILVSIPVELRKFFSGKRQIKRSSGSLRKVSTRAEAVVVSQGEKGEELIDEIMAKYYEIDLLISSAEKLLELLFAIYDDLGSFSMGWSGDFQKGIKAYNKGDYTTELKEWKPLAEGGYIYAEYDLGIMCYIGRGVPQDYQEAVKWFTLAAEQGSLQAQHNMAFLYYNGQGVKINKVYYTHVGKHSLIKWI